MTEYHTSFSMHDVAILPVLFVPIASQSYKGSCVDATRCIRILTFRKLLCRARPCKGRKGYTAAVLISCCLFCWSCHGLGTWGHLWESFQHSHVRSSISDATPRRAGTGQQLQASSEAFQSHKRKTFIDW